MVYLYDFGDDWAHDIEVETVTEPDREPLRLSCLDGNTDDRCVGAGESPREPERALSGDGF